MINEKQILAQLSQIIDPDFKRDIVSLGFIQNLKINGGDVSFDIALTTPACPIKEEFRSKAEELVKKIPDVKNVSIQMTVLKRIPAATTQPLPSGLKDVGSIIAVSSCKGGVGKSTLAAYLSLELARRGFKVGLLDADIHGPSVPSLFNLNSVELTANQAGQMNPIEKHNLKIMSFGFLLGDAPAVMRGPIVTRYIQQMLMNTNWGELDYLFIDMPPGTGDVQLTITQTIRLNGAVIVTTPQTLSLVDVSRGILMFERVSVPILGIIENMSYFICDNCDKKHFIFGTQGIENLKSRFGVETLAQIPILSQLIQKIEKPIANEYIMGAVDKMIMALGKNSLLKKEIPEIKFDSENILLNFPDGKKIAISHRNLRSNCRCALCINEMTGEKMLKEKDIRADIAPKEIFPLGNYALGINWNDGHSSGIYSYEMIRELTNMSLSP